MMSTISLKSHVALGLYLSLVGLLLASLVAASGGAYVHFVLLFLASLLGAYGLFWRLTARLPLRLVGVNGGLEAGWRERAAALVLVAAVAFACAHLARLGSIPVIQGMLEKDYYVVMLVRQYIFHAELHPIWKYGPNILVKSVLPFLVFFYLFRSRLLLVVTLIFGGLYAVSLMNKLFVVLLVTPAVIHALISRRWLAAAGLGIVPALGLALLVLVQNPHTQPQAFVDAMDGIRAHTSLGLDESQRAALVHYYETRAAEGEEGGAGGRWIGVAKEDRSRSGMSVASDTLYRRVFLVPGAVMTAWFSNIPARLPFASGCGYRWLAPLLHCDYVAYAFVIHDIENPGLSSKGVRGSMTAASFVEDYANFGMPGLVVSGVVLAAILSAIGRLFGSAWQANLALNSTPLILLLEIPLGTVILTGGWIITLLLYLLILPPPAPQPDHALSG